MSILELINRIKSPRALVKTQWLSARDTGETVSFDEKGSIVRHGLLDKLFLVTFITLIASLSFGIGRLSVAGDREPVQILYEELDNSREASSQTPSGSNSRVNQAASAVKAVSGGEVVVSKNGSKYHYSHCSGAKQIKEENKIVFNSPAAAEAAGYTLATNCRPR